MEGRDLNNTFEQERLHKHIAENRYEKILVLWGTEPLIELLYWYRHVEYREGIKGILKCLKDYSEEYYS